MLIVLIAIIARGSIDMMETPKLKAGHRIIVMNAIKTINVRNLVTRNGLVGVARRNERRR